MFYKFNSSFLYLHKETKQRKGGRSPGLLEADCPALLAEIRRHRKVTKFIPPCGVLHRFAFPLFAVFMPPFGGTAQQREMA
ncbi:MAG: hypothetical protein AMK70_05830 [Nitrospira bacterium SG8_35_1]|nr:MAG: hypothetical protein AMK70_05830 [Nitrospira bacterium SG8_35_1]